MKLFFLLLLCYLLGSIPCGYLITKFIKKEDIRQFGSGNIGATNVARIMGMKYGVLTALLDISKGFSAVCLIQLLLPETAVYIPFLAGLLSILGHDFSLFLKFSGGKGVATTIGVLLKLLPPVLAVGIVIWFLMVLLTRYVSLGSILGALSFPLSTYLIYQNYYFLIFTLIFALMIVITHRHNIKRLLQGNENQI